MESQKEDVVGISASIQIHSIQSQLPSFSVYRAHGGYRGHRELFQRAHVWRWRRVGRSGEIHSQSK